MHHEYEDGAGYHRGVRDGDIPIGAKILAAVGTYIAVTRPITRRDGTSTDAAAKHLENLTRHGTLNRDVTSAVLAATHGSSAPVTRTHAAGLSDRQVEVLQLLARGLSNKQIAQRLAISPRTAEHHSRTSTST
jgi:DNA-binding NarL/FixJ family response regulator